MTSVPVTNGTATNMGQTSMLLFNQQAAKRKLCGPLRARKGAQETPCR